jgi:predicted nucleic acid-binding protein
VAIEAGKAILSNPFIDLIHIDWLLHKEAWKIFQEIEHKNISFVDASIIAAMQAEGIKTLLTLDTTDFKKLVKRYRIKFYNP